MIDVVLEGPGKNALSTAVMEGLIARVEAHPGEPLLVRGAGDAFSAGLNLLELAGLDAAGMDRFLAALDDLLWRLYTHAAPTVALVNGHAIAGGCLVAMCCDHRVCAAEPNLKIGLNEVALGLRFPASVLALAARRVAPQSLDEVILGARLYGPQDALRVGLVDEVAAAAEAVARQRLADLARHPRDAYADAKRSLRAGLFERDPDRRTAARAALLTTWTSPELKNTIAAVLMARKK